MKLMKTLVALTAIGTFSLAQAAENLSAETAAPGGAPHLSVTHLAEVAGAAGIANLQVQAGQTLTNTVINIANGTTDVGVAPLVLPFLLKLGRGPYSKQGKEGAALAENLRALYPYNFGAYMLFGFQSKGVTSYEQLKGLTIYNGPPRGGALVGARQMLQLVGGIKEGDDYKGVQVNWGQANKTIADGTADMNLLPLTFPSDRVAAGQAAGAMTLISVPKATYSSDAFQKWARTPGNAPREIAVTEMGYGDDVKIVSEDATFRAVNITGAEIVNKSMSDALAKALTTAYIDSMDALKAKTPWAGTIGVGVLDAVESGFCGPNPLKYHPGAVAAWEEAGYSVPDCAKP
ncbi:MAG: TAXI family TRAP transporter solute-binding subunit [Pseudomonadota bacterium]